MLLSHEYRLVRASRDFSGWITPDGEYWKHSRTHSETLSNHGVNIRGSDAILDGYVWISDMGTNLYCELHPSRLYSLKRQLEKLLGDESRTISFDFINGSGERAGNIEIQYSHGLFDE
jgi:hypothetical protein